MIPRERPVLFSPPMVRAILEGHKTQTRRPLKNNEMYGTPSSQSSWIAGDRLYVREKHAIVPWTAYAFSEGVQQTRCPHDPHDAAIYAAGWDQSPPTLWRPSIHMPRWAARIFLEIIDVRVVRLQDINEEDAKAEGIECLYRLYDKKTICDLPGLNEFSFDSARDAFAALWDSLNTKPEYQWAASPWVFVISFKRVQP